MTTQDSENSEDSEDIDEQIDFAIRRLDLATQVYRRTGNREPLLAAIRFGRRVAARLEAQLGGEAENA